MYGATMGTLSVLDRLGSAVWSKSGNQGTGWGTATVTFTTGTLGSFEYERGTSYTGDAAIGDVTVTCGSSAAAPTAAPTSCSEPGTNCAWHKTAGHCVYPYWAAQCSCTCASSKAATMLAAGMLQMPAS